MNSTETVSAKTRTLLIVLLIASTMFGIGYAQEKNPVALQEAWYDCHMSDQKIGFAHFKIEKAEYLSKECYKFSDEMTLKVQTDESHVMEIKNRSVSLVDMNFYPIRITKTEINAGQAKNSDISVSGDEITFKITLNDEKPEITTIKKEPDLFPGIDGFILKAKDLLKVGAETSLRSLSPETKSIRTETVKILKEEKIKVGQEEIDTYYTESTNSEMPGEIMQVNVDKDGCVVLMKMAGIEIRRTNKTKAKKMTKTATISSYINTNANIAAFYAIGQMKLTITFRERFDDVIPANEYQDVVQDKEKYSITLKAIPDGIKNPVQPPAGDEAFKKYLNSSVKIQSKDAAIVAQAKAIVKDERDALKTTNLLCEWVFQNLKKERGAVAEKSAAETLRDKAGDCTEHAILLCALGRASGLPIRQISGLVFDGSRFGYHAWTEVYLGRWIPVDATLNRVGIPAGYIKLGEAEEGEKENNTTGLKISKMMGNVTIEITSARDKDNKSIDLSGKKKE
ncbi:MAG: transglutaminase domain-containing protein [Planctomycetes bacterium]|nr:transglutaminase domain-containing protein [Planctomycetota bacterium]